MLSKVLSCCVNVSSSSIHSPNKLVVGNIPTDFDSSSNFFTLSSRLPSFALFGATSLFAITKVESNITSVSENAMDFWSAPSTTTEEWLGGEAGKAKKSSLKKKKKTKGSLERKVSPIGLEDFPLENDVSSTIADESLFDEDHSGNGSVSSLYEGDSDDDGDDYRIKEVPPVAPPAQVNSRRKKSSRSRRGRSNRKKSRSPQKKIIRLKAGSDVGDLDFSQLPDLDLNSLIKAKQQKGTRLTPTRSDSSPSTSPESRHRKKIVRIKSSSDLSQLSASNHSSSNHSSSNSSLNHESTRITAKRSKSPKKMEKKKNSTQIEDYQAPTMPLSDDEVEIIKFRETANVPSMFDIVSNSRADTMGEILAAEKRSSRRNKRNKEDSEINELLMELEDMTSQADLLASGLQDISLVDKDKSDYNKSAKDKPELVKDSVLEFDQNSDSLFRLVNDEDTSPSIFDRIHSEKEKKAPSLYEDLSLEEEVDMDLTSSDVAGVEMLDNGIITAFNIGEIPTLESSAVAHVGDGFDLATKTDDASETDALDVFHGLSKVLETEMPSIQPDRNGDARLIELPLTDSDDLKVIDGSQTTALHRESSLNFSSLPTESRGRSAKRFDPLSSLDDQSLDLNHVRALSVPNMFDLISGNEGTDLDWTNLPERSNSVKDLFDETDYHNLSVDPDFGFDTGRRIVAGSEDNSPLGRKKSKVKKLLEEKGKEKAARIAGEASATDLDVPHKPKRRKGKKRNKSRRKDTEDSADADNGRTGAFLVMDAPPSVSNESMLSGEQPSLERTWSRSQLKVTEPELEVMETFGKSNEGVSHTEVKDLDNEQDRIIPEGSGSQSRRRLSVRFLRGENDPDMSTSLHGKFGNSDVAISLPHRRPSFDDCDDIAMIGRKEAAESELLLGQSAEDEKTYTIGKETGATLNDDLLPREREACAPLYNDVDDSNESSTGWTDEDEVSLEIVETGNDSNSDSTSSFYNKILENQEEKATIGDDNEASKNQDDLKSEAVQVEHKSPKDIQSSPKQFEAKQNTEVFERADQPLDDLRETHRSSRPTELNEKAKISFQEKGAASSQARTARASQSTRASQVRPRPSRDKINSERNLTTIESKQPSTTSGFIEQRRREREIRMAMVKERIRIRQEDKSKNKCVPDIELRREKAFEWYHRMAWPSKNEFKRKLIQLNGACDIELSDIDLLDWTPNGKRVARRIAK